ncbi:MAG: GspH/FimT family pseudopilin [Rhodospirillales bacterium]
MTARTATSSTGEPELVRGFTLLELVVVLIVMALVAAVATPTLIGRSGSTQAQVAAREMAAALRQARSSAIGANVDVAFAVDADARTYAIEGRPPHRLPGDLAISLIVADSERLSRTAGAIRFFPDGSSTGGDIAVVSAAGTFVVRVDWLTGQVRIDEGAPAVP